MKRLRLSMAAILAIVILPSATALAQETRQWDLRYSPQNTIPGRGRAIARDGDGAIYTAGFFNNGSNNDIMILKFTSAGVLDTTFGDNGIQTYNSGNVEEAYGIAVDADKNVYVTGLANNGANNDVIVLKYTPSGALDTTFSGDGVQTFDNGNADAGYSIAVDADKAIYIVGTASNGADNDILILKYTSAGALDATFSGDGKIVYNSGSNDEGKCVFVDSNKNVFVAGRSNAGGTYGALVMKYTSVGVLDNSFDFDGIQTYDTGGAGEEANAVAVDSLGNVYVAGSSNSLGIVIDALILMYDATGTLVNTFSGDGIQSYDSGNDDVANGVAVDASGNVYVVGTSTDPILGSTDVFILKFLPIGILTTTFSGDGIALYATADHDEGYGIVVDSAGNVYIAGTTEISIYSTNIVLCLKYSSWGGISTTISGRNLARANAVASDGNGNIYVAGYLWNDTSADFLIMKYTQAGALDTTFSGDGIQTYDNGGKSDYANGIAVDANGTVYVVGTSDFGGITSDIVVLKYTSSGDLDTTFNGTGIAIYDNASDDAGAAIALDSNGNAYIAGTSNFDILVLKYTSAGALDASFSGDGIQIYAGSGGGLDFGNAIAVDGNGNTYVAGEANNGTDSDIVVLKYTSSGALDTSFNSTGIRIHDSGGTDSGKAIAVDSSLNVYVAGDRGNDAVILKYTSSGSADTSFSGDGMQIYDTGVNESAKAILVDANGEIYVCGTIGNGSNLDFLLLNYKSDGTLDTNFDGDGVLVYDGELGSDYGGALAWNNAIYVTGGWNGTRAWTMKFAAVPDAPSNLSATTFSSTRIELSWKDNAISETGFQIEISYDGTTFREQGTVSTNGAAYSSMGLESGYTHYYRVRAYNDIGYSTYSNVASATTENDDDKRGFCYIGTSSADGNRWNLLIVAFALLAGFFLMRPIRVLLR